MILCDRYFSYCLYFMEICVEIVYVSCSYLLYFLGKVSITPSFQTYLHESEQSRFLEFFKFHECGYFLLSFLIFCFMLSSLLFLIRLGKLSLSYLKNQLSNFTFILKVFYFCFYLYFPLPAFIKCSCFPPLVEC